MAFRRSIQLLAQPFLNSGATKVACIEGRGFIFGTAVACELSLGIIPIRYPGKLQQSVYSASFIDYSGTAKSLAVHQDALVQGDRVIIVDDWIETGETIKASISLLERCGGTIAGIAALMDDASTEVKQLLGTYNYHFVLQTSDTDQF
ncbi:MAG: phosphoribosyltransferase family protein [Candidatus Sumerlaeaceae bacterium]